MKTWILRGGALLGLLVAGYALHLFLAPRGYGWIVWVLGGVVFAFFLLEQALRFRKRSRERSDWARWKASLDDPPARRRALEELRREIGRARRLGPRLRVRHTRLAVAMAELQLAEGKSDAAVSTLSKIDASKLDPPKGVVLRQARAQAYLHGGDVDGAAAALSPLGDTVKDPVLDATLTLLRGAVALEEGRVEEAKEAALRIVDAAAAHDELWDEAKALAAACAAASGGPHEALLREIQPAGRRRLARVGSSRIRPLIDALDSAERGGSGRGE